MAHVSLEERRARADEIVPHAAELRAAAEAAGLSELAMRDDGTVVVHYDEPGYRAVNRFSATASIIVGAYVHVITDDVPAAAGARPL
jgi:hypothetical protein